MTNTPLFIIVILTITMFSCVYTKSTKLGHKKFLKVNKIKTRINKENENPLNFTNNYPIIDKNYEESWKAAENSGDDAELNKYYLCQNFTLAKQIEQEIVNDLLLLKDNFTNHFNNLKIRKDQSFPINNTVSNYKIGESEEYQTFLDELFNTFEGKYFEKVEKIEQILNDDTYRNKLNVKCENYNTIPEPKNPHKNDTDIEKDEKNKIDDSKKHGETLTDLKFVELQNIKDMAKEMTGKERKIFTAMVSLLERVRKIVNTYSA